MEFSGAASLHFVNVRKRCFGLVLIPIPHAAFSIIYAVCSRLAELFSVVEHIVKECEKLCGNGAEKGCGALFCGAGARSGGEAYCVPLSKNFRDKTDRYRKRQCNVEFFYGRKGRGKSFFYCSEGVKNFKARSAFHRAQTRIAIF